MKTKDILKVVVICALATCASSCSAEQTEDRRPKTEDQKIESDTKQAVPDYRLRAERSGASPEGTTPESEASPTEDPRSSKYDFSDSSHWNLTVSAWERLAEKDYEGVFAYAEKCLELYELQAKETAKSMHTFVGFGHEDDYSLVNDVATSRYIMGEAYMRMGDPANALKEFNLVIQEYPYAQCWDPKGWFWKVAEVSKKNIEKINKANTGK